MPTRVRSGALVGIDGLDVTVEVDISRGLPGFHLVGLPNAEVRESRQRVLAALRHSGARVPPGRITVNLAPADIRKEGASFDLAIALGVLGAGAAPGLGALQARHGDTVFAGELSLFGELRPVRGLLAIVLAAVASGARRAVVPACQMAEAELVEGLEVIGAASLAEVLSWLRGAAPAQRADRRPQVLPEDPAAKRAAGRLADLSGLHLVRKAAILACVGRHNILLLGPPGTGKTRLARIMADLQPPLERHHALEVTRIHGAVGLATSAGLLVRPPFRAPHHTVTRAGLLGGGNGLHPGEITLAHRGMLFLDELTEFLPAVLDALREPLEDGEVTVARGAGRRCFPADVQLVAAMNPCRCGFTGIPDRVCRCTAADRRRYRARLSGPFLDRIDIFAEVGDWEGEWRLGAPRGAGGAADWRVRPQPEHMSAARRRRPGIGLGAAAVRCADRARRDLGLSLRAFRRGLEVARTIGALDGAQVVEEAHVREALEFRREAVLPDEAMPT